MQTVGSKLRRPVPRRRRDIHEGEAGSGGQVRQRAVESVDVGGDLDSIVVGGPGAPRAPS